MFSSRYLGLAHVFHFLHGERIWWMNDARLFFDNYNYNPTNRYKHTVGCQPLLFSFLVCVCGGMWLVIVVSTEHQGGSRLNRHTLLRRFRDKPGRIKESEHCNDKPQDAARQGEQIAPRKRHSCTEFGPFKVSNPY